MTTAFPQIVKSERQKRKEAADRAARWRLDHRLRPEPRVVDRVLIEAVCAAIADRDIVAAEIAAAIGRALLRGSEAGLLRLGYDPAEIRSAVATRLGEHAGSSRGSAVKGALADVEAGRPVRQVRVRRPSQVR